MAKQTKDRTERRRRKTKKNRKTGIRIAILEILNSPKMMKNKTRSETGLFEADSRFN